MDKRRKRLHIAGDYWDYWAPYAEIFSLVEEPEDAEVVLFAGGNDISPELYGDKNNGLSQTWPARDRREVALFKELRSRNIPMIGICRGAQFLTAMNGGMLYQDVDGHGLHRGHPIYTVEGYTLPMSSTHHQMMRPRGNYELLAWTPHRSKHYRTGRGEIQPELEVDPEIVWYPDGKALCIQGHPELLPTDGETNRYLRGLINRLIVSKM